MKLVFLDTETFYSKSFSLRKMSTQEYIYSPEFKVHGMGIAIERGPVKWFKGEQLKQVLNAVVPGNAVVCHNVSFDGSIITWLYGLIPALWIDTVSMSRAVVGERVRSHSLDNLAQVILKQEKGDFLSSVMGVRDLSQEQEAKLASYCLRDVTLCRSLFFALRPHLPVREYAVIDAIARMYTEPTFYLDQELLISYHSEIVAKKMRALDEAGIKDAKEVRSNPQFALALQNLGVDPPTKISPTTGEVTWAFAKSDPEFLALREHPNEMVQALVEARLENKTTIAETRAEALINAARYGEFPVSYLYSGAQTTHRLSGGGGFNMQNLPR